MGKVPTGYFESGENHSQHLCMLFRSWTFRQQPIKYAVINNKVLQYSTGNSIQYPVMNHNGEEYEIECTYA